MKLVPDADDVHWHDAPPIVTFYHGNGRKDRSFVAVDVPYVVGGKPMSITVHVVLGEVPCLLSKGLLQEKGAVIDTQGDC